ncbi:hypothetical protein [Streptomyces sp. NPDC092903]|uniref:hypothetical protein n=1 Tax=Streptomyces sp. NPDC092903 TaxID=3366017 RepID=UPI003820EA2E
MAAVRIGPTPLPRISAATASEAEDLSRSPDPTVRMLPAQRRDLPAGVRDRLAADPEAKAVKYIARHRACRNVSYGPWSNGTESRSWPGAANPDTPPALRDELARHVPPARRALREVARHPQTTGPAPLACLADSRARPLTARHPALPPRTLVELLAADDWQVVGAAAADPSLPPAVMRDLLPGAEQTPAAPAACH